MRRTHRYKLKTCIGLICIASLVSQGACCLGGRHPVTRIFQGCAGDYQYITCCSLDFCPFNDGKICTFIPCENFDPSPVCDPSTPNITTLSKTSATIGGDPFELTITGTRLTAIDPVIFFRSVSGNLSNASYIHTQITSNTDTQVVAQVRIDNESEETDYHHVVRVHTDHGYSNSIAFSVNYPTSLSANATLANRLSGISNPLGASFAEQMKSQAIPVGSVVITPVADGTVQQLSVKANQSASPDFIETTGPATVSKSIQVLGTPVDVVDQGTTFNFQRYGLASGGALNFGGGTQLEDYSKSLPVPRSSNATINQASFGAVGAIEFDLNSLKAALQQLNIPISSVRATVRLTPIRSLSLFDFLTDISQTQIPPSTEVALIEMTQNQKDLAISYKDFAGFTSPRISVVGDLAQSINNARPEQRATVRTDLLGMLAPVSFDVSGTVQRDLQTSAGTTGFQVASELNGTGIVFADSSTNIPGVSEMIAPQLVIELAGYKPSGSARFVTSTMKIPFDFLAQGFTDMILVTVNNIGANSGTIALDLTSGSNVFGLITPDGRPIGAQGNTVTIAAGDRFTFGVTFKPTEGENFQGELHVTDVTDSKNKIGNSITLTGSTLPLVFNTGIPTITAPIKPARLPDHAARVGDLNGDGFVDAVDIGLLSAFVASSISAPPPGTTAFAIADVNGDGAINSGDVAILGDALARNLAALPRSTPSASEISKRNPPALRSRQVAYARESAPASRRTGVAVMPGSRR